MKPQRRYVNRPSDPIQLRDNGAGKLPTIVGYAAVFYNAADPTGTAFRIWSDFEERIMPGAFNRALQEDDVRALFNHDSALVLGRTGAGTCRLSVDAKGLRYEIDPPDTTTARDLVASLQRGDISGSSFAFIPRATMDKREGDLSVIEIHDCQLFDVGPVTYPAYSGTEAGIRAAGPDLEELRAGVRRRREQAEWDVLSVELAVDEMGDVSDCTGARAP